MKPSFADILARQEIIRKAKIEEKLPIWASADGLQYPTDLSLEQCSSQSAAEFKASLAAGLFPDPSCAILWDLTGGLGVDSWAFSHYFGKVIYNERNGLLAEAAKENFAVLGAGNIEICCSDAEELALSGRPDIIFMDPARRDDAGHKVFRLEDCRPNLLPMLPSLLEKAQYIMVKLSPMADISMLAARFRECLRDVYVIGIGGECKELLCLLTRQRQEQYRIVVKELSDGSEFIFVPDEPAVPRFAGAAVGDWIWEPRSPLMKAGCYNLIADRFGISALDSSTHLYVASEPCCSMLFRPFRIVEILDFGKSGFKEAGVKYPLADVTARNVPMSSDELKKRLGVKSGAEYHIFGCLTPSGRKLLVTKCSHQSERKQSEQ